MMDARPPLWLLGVETVNGDDKLRCHYEDPPHAAVTLISPRVCDAPSCRAVLSSKAWATLDRTVVLCARCHALAHDPGEQLRPNAGDPYRFLQ